MQPTLILAALVGLASAKGGQGTPAAATTDASPAAGTGLFGGADVCFPKQSNGTYDRTSPCVQALTQSVKCQAFADDGGNATASGGNGDFDPEQLSKRLNLFNATLNLACVCKPNEPGTTYFENVAG
jgi:hypothetical protein